MKVVLLSNYFNHHQRPLADAMYKALLEDYRFVETNGMPKYRHNLGYQEQTAPYVLRYNEDTQDTIDKLIMEADVVQFGEAPLKLIKKRVASGKIVIRDDECRYRNYTKFLKWPFYTYNSLFLNKGYLLCASAFAPIDYFLSGMKPSHCYKWGYFTEVKEYNDIHSLINTKGESGKRISILWVGRLVKLKHPESALYVAYKLKKAGYNFNFNIIGVGPEYSKLKKTISIMGLMDVVHLLGSMPPEEVRKYMERANIFMFTSDRNEGWGAVLNESLNSACAVVAANNIGSVPYLLNDRINGLIFKDKNWDDLTEKIEWLINNPVERAEMGRQAYLTMLNTWNADKASNNLIMLYKALLTNEETPIPEGPCSKAPLILRTFGNFKTL